MTTLKHLQAAARLLVEKGWCQGHYLDHLGRACAIGAVTSVPGNGLGDVGNVIECLLNLIEVKLNIWNDTPGRTKDEVLELFNYAIALEAGKVAA